MRLSIVLGVALSLLGTPVLAQQQNLSPAEAANQVIAVISQLGQIASNQQREIEGLNKQIADLKRQLDEAKKPPITSKPDRGIPLGPPPHRDIPLGPPPHEQ